MSNEYADRSGDTEQFKAFTRAPRDTAPRSRVPLVIGGAVVAALVALVMLLLLR
jgi:hypothetical protein